VPGCALRFACASTLTLILITSYFVRCILYIKESWVSSELFATEDTENTEKFVVGGFSSLCGIFFRGANVKLESVGQG